MNTFEILLACISAAVHARLARRSMAVWLILTAWSTLSLSTLAADATGIFEWLPDVAWFRALGVLWFAISIPLLLAVRLRAKPAYTDLSRRQFLGRAAT